MPIGFASNSMERRLLSPANAPYTCNFGTDANDNSPRKNGESMRSHRSPP